MLQKSFFCAVLFSFLAINGHSVLATGAGSQDFDTDGSAVPYTKVSETCTLSPGELFTWKEHLRERATDFGSPEQLRALSLLWDIDRGARGEMRPVLLEIAQDAEHHDQMSAVTLLWNSDEELEGTNRLSLLPTVMQIAETLGSPHRLDAATKLWRSGGDQQTQNRAFAREHLREIVRDTSNPLRQRQDALFCLGESDNLHDQDFVRDFSALRPAQRNTKKALFR